MLNKIKHEKWNDGCTSRINKLRDDYWNHFPEIDLERALIYTDVYKKCEADEVIIKRAKALYEYIKNKTITISDEELIIGTDGKKHRSAVVCPEMSWRWYQDELDTMSTRAQDPYYITEEDKRILKDEIFPYWEGKSMEDFFLANVPEDLKYVGIGTNVIFGDLKSQSGAGEFGVGFHNIIIKKGFKGVQEEAETYMSRLDKNDPKYFEKSKFYEAIIICCEAAKLLGKRHAEEAYKLSENTQDNVRKKELLEIAAVCEKVPYYPPETFREALQTVWFSEMFLWSEENANSNCIDRPDQYLYAFYKNDIEKGKITKIEAQELIECMWIKMAEIIFVIAEESAAFYAGYMSFHGLTLAGVDEDGNNASNELSYMMIQATMDLRMHSPTINVRFSDKTPDEFIDKVLDLVKLGTGQPAIFFDNTAIEILKKRGIPEKDARNWCVGGCVEPNVPGKTSLWAEGCRYSYATAVEWALFNGYSKVLDRQLGLETGDPRTFKTFDDFENAVKKQLEFLVSYAVRFTQLSEIAHQRRAPKPVRSICLEGCLESGKDAMFGGGLYNNGPGLETTGIADLADSLAAVKKLVFDEKRIAMGELLDALEADFEGYEVIRQMLINNAPKYGNDIDEVDDFAKEYIELSCKEAAKYEGVNGSTFISGLVPVSSNIPHGQAIWALPSGRKAKESLSDGISPFPGYDVNGPTAVLRSVCKVDHSSNGCGTLLNMKLNPSLLETESDRKNFASLLKAESSMGGYHVQFNVVSSDTLRKAQKNPQKYSDLLVRVAGYSAFFVELAGEAQDAIIARTENTEW